MKKLKSVQEYFDTLENFPEETKKLRKTITSMPVEECLKWSMPVYVAAGKNVLGLFTTKNHCGIWFYQGALLKDKAKVLVNAQEGKTKALRQWRITKMSEIKVKTIKEYILEAISLAEQGVEIKPNRNKPLNIPVELEKALAKNKKTRIAFDALSKSCKREYAEYIAEAKREETKLRRIEKIIPMISNSVGLNDKYRK